MKPFKKRINKYALKELRQKWFPSPIDALNLVTLKNQKAYRWYGFLLAPLVLLFGGRLIYFGIFQKTIYGEKLADEIVIIRYPNHRRLLRIISSWFYSLVNILREEGVKKLGFSLNKPVPGHKKFDRKGLYVFIGFSLKASENINEALGAFKYLLKGKKLDISYASYHMGDLSIIDAPTPSDPNSTRFNNILLIKVNPLDKVDIIFDKQTIKNIKNQTEDFSIQVFRS